MPDNNLSGRVLNAFIDFDLVVNTELGLIRFIRENYQDDRAFNLEILNKSDRTILSLLFSRTNYNPLSIISTEDNMGDIDKLYDSFFSTYKEKIIALSISDATIFKFVSYVVASGANFGVSSFFGVRDDLERESLASHFGPLNTVDKTNPGNMLGRDIYYIKDYKVFTDLKLENKIVNHKIYFSPRKYVLDYFNSTENSLTTKNVFSTFGKDYSHPKGKLNET